MLKKLLLFCTAALAIDDANGVLLCQIPPIPSPAACSSFTQNYSVDFNRVYDCSGGGSSVTEFEVWGGCGPTTGSGDWHNPIVQTPSGMQLATNEAGRFCYCQIKSINGTAVASSPRWVRGNYYENTARCAIFCTYYCASFCSSPSSYTPAFRSALFQTLQ